MDIRRVKRRCQWCDIFCWRRQYLQSETLLSHQVTEIWKYLPKILRYTQGVSVFPVGLVGKFGLSSPVVKEGKQVVDGWYDNWDHGRKFMLDMAGFSVSVALYRNRSLAQGSPILMPPRRGREEQRHKNFSCRVALKPGLYRFLLIMVQWAVLMCRDCSKCILFRIWRLRFFFGIGNNKYLEAFHPENFWLSLWLF